ncbi:hypothetical protein [Citrobacter enshiensis]|uniref:hypothetical protein n=1 Tax=Citrobacter enshiensis TaxID=2971264 RepID=UPI0023E85B32|nr:hypothetical protein [Citrobacter enshiensis]WET42284.1 hypothetical protein P2W74_09075 [Citrobacter enshiensis]
MSILIIIESLTIKVNLLYVVFSLFGLHVNFLILKKILTPEESMQNVYALLISLMLPFFHFYVFHFGVIPFIDIELNDNIPLYYISFGLAWLSGLPYIIARRLYT